MMSRVSRKLRQMRTWAVSVNGPADWPAALLLGFFRTRPPTGAGLVDRGMRRLFPYIWIHPRSLSGWRLRINPARMSQFVIYEEVFMARSYDLGHVSFVPDAIVDCGAFEGYFSLLAKARFPDSLVTAFEPNAENFDGLLANIRANQLDVDARCEAVSIADGEATFVGDGCGGHLAGGDVAGRTAKVVTCDLRRVLAQIAPERLLLKLDIEGEERPLIPALLPMLPRRCAVFFEWHHGDESFQHVADLLREGGFAVERHRTMVDDGLPFIDAFAQRDEVA
jgi:FkbM family methyltransferase